MRTSCFRMTSGNPNVPDTASDLDGPSTLVLVFGTSVNPSSEAWFQTLRDAFPRSRLVGCSSAGEILGTCLEDDSWSVAVMQFEHTGLKVVSAEIRSSRSSFDVGASLVSNLQGPDLSGILVLSDGLNVNGSALIQGINSQIPPEVVVVGGLAGDGQSFHQTWVMAEGAPRTGLIAAVGLYGKRVVLTYGSRGGWTPFGPEREVTRSDANVLYELNGKPALALYKRYLGDLAAQLPASAMYLPLCLRTEEADGRRLVRSVLSVDETAGSITFAGDIPMGSRVQFMRGNTEELVEGAATAATSMASQEPPHDGVCIAVSCVGRRMLLGERTEEELQAVAEQLPANMPIIGFYSYGELSPLGSGRCELHNKTMTLSVIGER